LTDSLSSMLVLGAGAWGSAFASRISVGHPDATTFLWSRSANHIKQLRANNANEKYLSGVKLSQKISYSYDLDEIVVDWSNNFKNKPGLKILVLAVPVSGMFEICSRLKKIDALECSCIVWLCKGSIKTDEGVFWPSQIIRKFFPGVFSLALSGPSFAQEVASGLPFALTCAGVNLIFARKVAKALKCNGLRIYSSSDLIGVELAGAMKNVLAIAAGVCDGMKLGLNARASLITRGLSETTRLGMTLGAKKETFFGLAALGDLVLTTTGNLSRNRQVGLRLAEGDSLELILTTLGHVAEGVTTAPLLLEIAAGKNVEVPITKSVCDLLKGVTKPEDALNSLLSRDYSDETKSLFR
jgi:glycerol-3-phosphate dehydrogenase (NAD(P)+)